MKAQNISLDTALYLQHTLGINAIKNEIIHDEDIATLDCTFAGHAFKVFWSYTNGFTLNADVFTKGPMFDSLIVAHVKKQLTEMTFFQGYDAEKGYAGLVLKN